MTFEDAIEEGKNISRTYGETCVFRERSATESYQATAGMPALGGTVVAILDDGKVLRQIAPVTPDKGASDRD